MLPIDRTADRTSDEFAAHAPRRAAWIYGLALALLAAFAILSHAMMRHMMQREASATATIRIAGRQRTLSQRITRVAIELHDGSLPPAIGAPLLRDLANTMQQNQDRLLNGYAPGNILPPTSQALLDLYRSRDTNLAGAVEDFIAHARRFAAAPSPTQPGNRDLAAMRLEASATLLDLLDRALQQYTNDALADMQSIQSLSTWLTIGMLLTILLEALFVYRPLFRKMSRLVSELTEASATDSLTGLFNRRALLQVAERAHARLRRDKRPFCILMADLDHFKEINDRYGHATGDLVLREFASCLEQCLRHTDRAGRIGGEEFAVILSESHLAGACLVAERIRQRFEERAATLLPGVATLRPTVSIGIVAAAGNSSVPALLEEADRLLYRAKAGGRNRVLAERPTAPAALRLRLVDDPA